MRRELPHPSSLVRCETPRKTFSKLGIPSDTVVSPSAKLLPGMRTIAFLNKLQVLCRSWFHKQKTPARLYRCRQRIHP